MVPATLSAQAWDRAASALARVVISFPEKYSPRFPISLYGSEWNEWSYEDDLDLAMGTEFVDDSGPPYRAIDAEGYPVRLIVWNVELLVCHRVFVTVAGGQPHLRLSELRTPQGAEMTVEVHNGEPVRALVRSREGYRALPELWSGPVDATAPTLPSTRSLTEFHSSWMRSRTRKRYP